MRDRSPVETLFAYASFGALSIALHLVVILGGRDPGAPLPLPGSAAQVTSARPAPEARRGAAARQAPRAPTPPARRSSGRPS